MSGLLKRFLKIMNQCQSILEKFCVGDLLANVIRTTKYVNISYSWRKSYIFSTPQNILYVILMDVKVDKSISIRYYNAGDQTIKIAGILVSFKPVILLKLLNVIEAIANVSVDYYKVIADGKSKTVSC